MGFPERIYTVGEIERARKLANGGYRHRINVEGSSGFRRRVGKAIEFVKAAGYYDFLTTYIRTIKEIDGLTQLRQADAAIWANQYAVENAVDAASMFVQKACFMKGYLEGELYYGGVAEKRSVEKRIRFLEALMSKSAESDVVAECERLLKLWYEGSLAY